MPRKPPSQEIGCRMNSLSFKEPRSIRVGDRVGGWGGGEGDPNLDNEVGRNGLSPKVTIVTIPIDVFGEFRLPYRTTLALLRLGLTFTL